MSSEIAHSATSLFNVDRPVIPDICRPLGGEQRITAIDGLRALAMLMVYTYHVWQFSGSPALHAWMHSLSIGAVIGQFSAGVDLFMVLSGFCLFYPIAKTPGATLDSWSANAYFKRRIRRIVPPYYAAIGYATILPLFLVIVWRILGQPAKWQTPPDLWQYLTHAFFIHTLFLGTWDGIQGVFWSLGLEAQFYLVFPLVVFGYRRFGIRVAWAMIALSVLYRVGVSALVHNSDWHVSFLFSITFLGRWMQFAAGMLAARTVVGRVTDRRLISSTAATFLFLAAVTIYTVAVLDPVQRVGILPLRDLLLAAAFAIAIVTLCAGRTPIRAAFECRPVAWLGLISYSVFLIHQNTIYYVGEAFRRVHIGDAARFALFMTLGFALILGVSGLFFRLFEAPFLRKSPKSVSAERIAAPILAAVAN
jgi:peptidoglycan/LPS O-acetylase OafA/YrhL